MLFSSSFSFNLCVESFIFNFLFMLFSLFVVV